MHADVVLIRLIFTGILVAAGYILRPVAGDSWISAGVGALVAICIILFELRIRRATLKTLIGAAVGSILGIIGAYLMVYATLRFIVEFFRVHEQGNLLGGPFDTSQWISVALFAAGAACLRRMRRVTTPATA